MFEHETGLLERGELSDFALVEQLTELFSLIPDEAHHRKEDTLYHQLAERLSRDMAGQCDNLYAIFDLRSDHQEMAAFAETLREGVSQLLAGAELPRADLIGICTTFIEQFRTYMLNEEIHFFP